MVPLSVFVTTAILTFPVLLFFTKEGIMFTGCFNWKGYCDPDEFNLWLSQFYRKDSEINYNVSRDILSYYVAFVIAIIVVTVASAIACLCTWLCHQCCSTSYENHCFPMTHKVIYDTSNPYV